MKGCRKFSGARFRAKEQNGHGHIVSRNFFRLRPRDRGDARGSGCSGGHGSGIGSLHAAWRLRIKFLAFWTFCSSPEAPQRAQSCQMAGKSFFGIPGRKLSLAFWMFCSSSEAPQGVQSGQMAVIFSKIQGEIVSEHSGCLAALLKPPMGVQSC